MIDWIRKKRVRKGKIIVGWPAKDLREDRIITDVSKLDQHVVGIRRRRYGVLHRKDPVPEFSEEEEYVPLSRLWKTQYIGLTEQDIRQVSSEAAPSASPDEPSM